MAAHGKERTHISMQDSSGMVCAVCMVAGGEDGGNNNSSNVTRRASGVPHRVTPSRRQGRRATLTASPLAPAQLTASILRQHPHTSPIPHPHPLPKVSHLPVPCPTPPLTSPPSTTPPYCTHRLSHIRAQGLACHGC